MKPSKTSSRARSPRKKTYTVAQLKKRAWKLLSEFVRRTAAMQYDPGDDNWVACYTCDQEVPWKQIQAGHAIPGRTGAVLLDEEIIRPQCYRCNVALRGNYQAFIPRLLKERSLARPVEDPLQWWEEKLAFARRVKKWSKSDLLSRIEDYQTKLLTLKE